MTWKQLLLLPVRGAWAAFTFILVYVCACNVLQKKRPHWFPIASEQFFIALLRFLDIHLVYQQAQTHTLQDVQRQQTKQFLTQFHRVVFISNHVSSFDLFLMPHLLKKCYFAVTTDVLKLPLLRKVVSKTPVVFVNPQKRSARAECVRQIHTLLQHSEYSVGLFPEGQSNPRLGPFALGAFSLAYKTKRPIVPLYLHYHERAVFSPDATVSHKKELARILSIPRKTITVYQFKPIDPHDFASPLALHQAVHDLYQHWETVLSGLV